MKVPRKVIWLLVSVIVALPSSGAIAEDGAQRAPVPAIAPTDAKITTIHLNSPDWQIVIDNLFGTLDAPDGGLLDGTKNFELRAEDLVLTSTQAEFFTAIDSPQSLSGLIEAAELLRGKIRLDGTIDGQPFELKLAGRELKISGLTLTAAQRDALVAELSGISGLHEMKIEAIVDGQRTITKVQGGHEKLEIRSASGRPVHTGKPERVEIERRGRSLGHERIERLERIDRPERPERPGRR